MDNTRTQEFFNKFIRLLLILLFWDNYEVLLTMQPAYEPSRNWNNMVDIERAKMRETLVEAIPVVVYLLDCGQACP